MVRRSGGSTAAWCDRLLDGTVVLLATWTLVYHVCLVTRLGATPAILLELLALALAGVAAIAARRRRPPSPEAYDEPTPETRLARWARPLLVVTAGAAGVAAAALAVSAPWVLVWVPWLVAAVTGTGWAFARLRRSDTREVPAASRHDREEGEHDESRLTVAVVLAWTVGLGVFTLWSLRPNPDDLFYLNLSQWVAAHGEFPVRDTLFADLVYPMSNWPPVASYDGLVGVVARIVGAHAASVEYIWVPPVATALSVLALWRLLRTWRVRHVAWALSVALAFLLLDGTASYGTPGNLFLTRLWQGKVILLCLLVPLLLVHALRYVERPTRSRLAPLALTGVASVGLTTTAMFLTPLIAVAGMAPLLPRARGRALAGFAAMAGYPVGAALVTVAVGGRSADDFGARRLYRFDASWIGHLIFLTGVVALVAVLAVLLGALLVPHPAARVTTGVLVLCTGVVLVPGVTRLAYDVAGVGPTLWRVSWGSTVAALVAVAVVRAASGLHAVAGRWRLGRGATPVAALAAVALLAGFGHPIWSHDTNTYLHDPVHWQRSYSSRAVVTKILRETRPGDVVLAPDAISVTLAVTTTSVKTVAPRDYYLHYLEHDPTFHYADRLALWQYVNDVSTKPPPDLRGALRRVGVVVACTAIADERRYDAIRRAGYRPLFATPGYRCLGTRDRPGTGVQTGEAVAPSYVDMLTKTRPNLRPRASAREQVGERGKPCEPWHSSPGPRAFSSGPA